MDAVKSWAAFCLYFPCLDWTSGVRGSCRAVWGVSAERGVFQALVCPPFISHVYKSHPTPLSAESSGALNHS